MDTAKLRKDIQKRLDKWDERNCFTLAGVKGLTRGDINILLMCCDRFDQHGSLNGLAYLAPEVKSVLAKYGTVFINERRRQ